MGKKFNPNYNYKGTSDYNYDNANRIIDNPFDSSQFINNRDWVEGDPYGQTLPMPSDNTSAESSNDLPMPKQNTSIWEDVKSGFMSGLNKADQAIMDIPRTIYKPFSWLSDKVLPGYDPKQDMILQSLNSASDYYKNNASEYDKSIGNSKGSKVAATIAGFVPQGVEMGLSLGIPLPKIGSMGKVLDNFGTPIEKSVSGLLNDSKLGEYAGKMAKNSSEFAALNALDTAAQGGDFSDIGKSALEGAGMGALFGAGGKAIGEVLHYIPGLGKVKPIKEDGNRVTFEDQNGNIQDMNKTIFDNTAQIKPMESINQSSNINMPLPNKVSEMPFIGDMNPNRVAYNKMELPNINNSTEIPMPNFKNRQFAENSILNSNVVPKELKSKIEQDMPTYEPITNKETWQKATERVNKDPIQAEKDYWDTNSLKTANDTALGESLIVKAIKDGDIEKANRLTADLSAKLTEAGQTVQAAAMMKRLSPEGMLMYANKVVNRVNKEVESGLGKNVSKIGLTKEDANKILEGMRRFQELPDGSEKDIALAQVKQVIADKIPVTVADKVKSVQRISMLLNPKTMIRNVLGNLISGLGDNVKDIVGAPVDMLVGLKTGKRTTALPTLNSLKVQGQGLISGTKNTVNDAKLGIDTSMNTGQYELPQADIWKNPIMNKLENVTSVGLKFGDRPFYEAAYNKSLNEQMKLSKTDKPTTEMIDQAKQHADEVTYQNVNEIVKAFQTSQKALNGFGSYVGVGSKEFGLGNFVLPFTKTPANMLKMGIDYSPVGVINVAKEAMKKGENFDQKSFVDSISKTVTGTGAILLGYDLAKNGIITGQKNKDKDVAALDKNMGIGEYAINTSALKRWINGGDTSLQKGDTFKTYSWAQPTSIVLAVGADIYKNNKDRNSAVNVALDALKSGGTTLFQQSLLQGLQKFMGGYSPMDNIGQTLINAPTGFVPSLFNQARQLKDSTVKDTYDNNQVQQMLNQVTNKTPFNEKLPTKIDTLGQPMEQYQGNNSVWNVMFNPGFTTSYLPTPSMEVAKKIYDKAGETIQFPREAPKSIKDSEDNNVPLTAQEINEYQQYIGQKTNSLLEAHAGLLNGDYSKDTYISAAKDISNKMTDINTEAKNKILQERNLPLPKKNAPKKKK